MVSSDGFSLSTVIVADSLVELGSAFVADSVEDAVRVPVPVVLAVVDAVVVESVVVKV
jgi:hypothetical protein